MPVDSFPVSSLELAYANWLIYLPSWVYLEKLDILPLKGKESDSLIGIVPRAGPLINVQWRDGIQALETGTFWGSKISPMYVFR